MGNPIVYCGGCGRSLREDDFTKGKAHTVDNRPYCTGCKPMPESRRGQGGPLPHTGQGSQVAKPFEWL